MEWGSAAMTTLGATLWMWGSVAFICVIVLGHSIADSYRRTEKKWRAFYFAACILWPITAVLTIAYFMIGVVFKGIKGWFAE